MAAIELGVFLAIELGSIQTSTFILQEFLGLVNLWNSFVQSWMQWYRRCMREISPNNFGLLIAFVLPGFMALWGGAYLSPVLRSWLEGSEAAGPTVGGFLYVTLASVGTGLTVSTVRWAVIDTIHGWTGLPQPKWDYSRLQSNVNAFKMLNENHYKFYQFYGNGLVSLVFFYVARRLHLGLWTAFGWFDVAALLLGIVFYSGSRDTLRKYYQRVNDMLGNEPIATPTTVPVDDPKAKNVST
jgi:hypothetical protein